MVTTRSAGKRSAETEVEIMDEKEVKRLKIEMVDHPSFREDNTNNNDIGAGAEPAPAQAGVAMPVDTDDMGAMDAASIVGDGIAGAASWEVDEEDVPAMYIVNDMVVDDQILSAASFIRWGIKEKPTNNAGTRNTGEPAAMDVDLPMKTEAVPAMMDFWAARVMVSLKQPAKDARVRKAGEPATMNADVPTEADAEALAAMMGFSAVMRMTAMAAAAAAATEAAGPGSPSTQTFTGGEVRLAQAAGHMDGAPSTGGAATGTARTGPFGGLFGNMKDGNGSKGGLDSSSTGTADEDMSPEKHSTPSSASPSASASPSPNVDSSERKGKRRRNEDDDDEHDDEDDEDDDGSEHRVPKRPRR